MLALTLLGPLGCLREGDEMSFLTFCQNLKLILKTKTEIWKLKLKHKVKILKTLFEICFDRLVSNDLHSHLRVTCSTWCTESPLPPRGAAVGIHSWKPRALSDLNMGLLRHFSATR